MVKQRLFIMDGGTYRETSGFDPGPLIYRSEEGGKKRQRNTSIIMTINTQIAFFWLVVFIVNFLEQPRWEFLGFLVIPSAIFAWIYLDWRQYRTAGPVTEVYEKGILLQKVSWPRQDAFYWPYGEIASIQLKGKTVRLRSRENGRKESLPLYEVGEVGLNIIENRMRELSASEDRAPKLIVYE